jgi:hypothetical protein
MSVGVGNEKHLRLNNTMTTTSRFYSDDIFPSCRDEFSRTFSTDSLSFCPPPPPPPSLPSANISLSRAVSVISCIITTPFRDGGVATVYA